jgi:hypothetical protein
MPVAPFTLTPSFVGCVEVRTASFAIDAVPIVTASYDPFNPEIDDLGFLFLRIN